MSHLLCIFQFQPINCDAKYVPLVTDNWFDQFDYESVELVYHNNPFNSLSISPCL